MMASFISPVVYPRFRDHAAEIQQAIWRFSFPSPRVIQVQLNREGKIFFSNATPPAALQVCFDSRKEALKSYSPLFESALGPYSPRKSPRPIYANLARDIIYVAGGYPDNPIHRLNNLLSVYPDMQKFASIAVDLLTHKVSDIYDRTRSKLDRFEKLKSLWIVVGREGYAKVMGFRTGAHLELHEICAASAERATDTKGVFLEEWGMNKGREPGQSRNEEERSPLGTQQLMVHYVEVKLVLHAPTYV